MKTTASFLNSMAYGIRAFRSLVQTKGGRLREARYRNLVSYALSYKATDLSIKSLDAHVSELRTRLPRAAKELESNQANARNILLRVRKLYFSKVHSMIDKHSIDEYNQIRKIMGLPTVQVNMLSRLRAQVTVKADPSLSKVRKKLQRISAP